VSRWIGQTCGKVYLQVDLLRAAGDIQERLIEEDCRITCMLALLGRSKVQGDNEDLLRLGGPLRGRRNPNGEARRRRDGRRDRFLGACDRKHDEQRHGGAQQAATSDASDHCPLRPAKNDNDIDPP
jgi:hypothetical protein